VELIHTVLFLLRENALQADLAKADRCFQSLEKSAHKTVIVWNQGFWSNERVQSYLDAFALHCVIIGSGSNSGIVVGRQSCFEYIWANYPGALFVSELHLDMVFTSRWEDPLVEYLYAHDEPMIGCGIVSMTGFMPSLNVTVQPPPHDINEIEDYLTTLKRNEVGQGLTHPCIHKLEVLQAVGGYNTSFMTGMQAFEDDSLLVSYHYYYGTRANWAPKVNYRSIVIHELGGQRFGLRDDMMVNLSGLVRQYGAMGMKSLSNMHSSAWHVQFFGGKFREIASIK